MVYQNTSKTVQASLPKVEACKKTSLKTIAKLMLITLALFVFNQSASSYDFKSNDIYYTIKLRSEYVEVSESGDNSYSGSVTIPRTVTYNGKTYTVCGILSFAFSNCSNLTSVSLSSEVTSIGVGAFYGCKNLKTVNIPKGVSTIGNRTFQDCSSLTSISLPSTVTSIGEDAFSGCRSLTSLNIPSKVKTIGGGAFWNCSSLTSIKIPSKITKIEKSTFGCCSGLTSLTIPDGVTSIGASAFYGCHGLKSINIPDGVTSIEESTFSGCSGLTSLTIPIGVTSIGDEAFARCSGLTSMTIPDGVTALNESVFEDCSGLTSVTIGSGVKKILESAFYNCSALTSIVIPNKVTSIGKSAFCKCSSLSSVTFGDKVTSIGEYAFSSCKSLTSLVFPDKVTSIGDHTFANCTGLTSITFGEKVSSMGYYTFENCYNVIEIYCKCATPPSCNSSTFGSIPKSTCNLYVPKSSLETYKTTDVWKDFKNIYGKTFGDLNIAYEKATATTDSLTKALNDAIKTIEEKYGDVKDSADIVNAETAIADSIAALVENIKEAYEAGTLLDDYDTLLADTTNINAAINKLIEDAAAAQKEFNLKDAYEKATAELNALIESFGETKDYINNNYSDVATASAITAQESDIEDMINALKQAIEDAYTDKSLYDNYDDVLSDKSSIETAIAKLLDNAKLLHEYIIDGINTLSADKSEEVPTYNIAGQRVKKSTRGLVIMGGKKYVVK